MQGKSFPQDGLKGWLGPLQEFSLTTEWVRVRDHWGSPSPASLLREDSPEHTAQDSAQTHFGYPREGDSTPSLSTVPVLSHLHSEEVTDTFSVSSKCMGL